MCGKIKRKFLLPRLGDRRIVEAIYAEAKVVADTFYIIADLNRRMDEARRMEQDIHRKAGANTELLS
jgi:hypothetical protein